MMNLVNPLTFPDQRDVVWDLGQQLLVWAPSLRLVFQSSYICGLLTCFFIRRIPPLLYPTNGVRVQGLGCPWGRGERTISRVTSDLLVPTVIRSLFLTCMWPSFFFSGCCSPFFSILRNKRVRRPANGSNKSLGLEPQILHVTSKAPVLGYPLRLFILRA